MLSAPDMATIMVAWTAMLLLRVLMAADTTASEAALAAIDAPALAIAVEAVVEAAARLVLAVIRAAWVVAAALEAAAALVLSAARSMLETLATELASEVTALLLVASTAGRVEMVFVWLARLLDKDASGRAAMLRFVAVVVLSEATATEAATWAVERATQNGHGE